MITLDELLYASEEDKAFFAKCIEGLPKAGVGLDSNGEPMPYACDAHSVRCLREIVEIVKPKEIFEIGFNCGYSAAMWLELAPDARMFSCDISNRSETLQAGETLIKRYPKRIHVQIVDSARIHEASILMDWLTNVKWDLIFIDGGHLEEDVMHDIQLALKLGIKWLAFDDWLEQFGPGVQPAVNRHKELELIKVMGNIALVKNTSVA